MVLGSNKIPDGTSVAGVDVGGLDRQSAINKLNAAFAQQAQAPITLKVSQTTSRVPADALGISVNYPETVDSVLTSRLNPFDTWREWRGGGDGDLVFNLDNSTFQRKIDDLSQQYKPTRRRARDYVQRHYSAAVGPAVGKSIDRDSAAAAVMAHYLRGKGTIELPMVEQQPQVSAEQAKKLVLNGLCDPCRQ